MLSFFDFSTATAPNTADTWPLRFFQIQVDRPIVALKIMRSSSVCGRCRLLRSVVQLFILFQLAIITDTFLIGACIGPKTTFERYLTPPEKKELTLLIENKFDGSNRNEVLRDIYKFLRERLTVNQWESIIPEIGSYQKKNYPCSPYSQLLPPRYYKPLLKAVRRAAENGADRRKIKYLVEDYLDRVLYTKEFVKEFRKQTHITELPKSVGSGTSVLRPMPVSPMPVIRLPPPTTTTPKPVFPLIEAWRFLPMLGNATPMPLNLG
uniref:Uncharacterized protein n=1 Tax=Panagrellus redivivus TaxID=6233 RepID=A0A7E4ZW57_PANRE